MDNYREGAKISILSVIINLILATFKLVAGILGNSSAMIADGIHTLSDVLTTFVVLIGLKVSYKEADDKHQYGHERFESVFAKLLSVLLLLTGIIIAYKSLTVLLSGDIEAPKQLALIAAFISILTKECMYRYTIKVAKRIKSIAMEADAWHHRSDALSSFGTFFGILGAQIGLTILDPIAGIIVSGFIIKIAIELYLKSVKELVDECANDELIDNIRKITCSTNNIIGIKNLKTRIFGSKVYVDLEIFVESDITVQEGHDIAQNVHDCLEKNLVDIKHCMVHIEPYKNK